MRETSINITFVVYSFVVMIYEVILWPFDIVGRSRRLKILSCLIDDFRFKRHRHETISGEISCSAFLLKFMLMFLFSWIMIILK